GAFFMSWSGCADVPIQYFWLRRCSHTVAQMFPYKHSYPQGLSWGFIYFPWSLITINCRTISSRGKPTSQRYRQPIDKIPSWLTPSLPFGCAAAKVTCVTSLPPRTSWTTQAQQPPGLQRTKEPLKTNHIKESPVISSLLLMLTGVGKPLLLLSKLRKNGL